MLEKPCPIRDFAVGLGLLALAVGMPSVTAQEQRADERARGGSNKAPSDSETTAEDVLRAMQRNRPPNDIIRPTGSPADLRGATRRLLPEGASIVDRTGHIERRGDDWVFVAEDPDGAAPLPLIRNATLEVVIRTAAGAPARISFVVSGEISVFRGGNYLLLRSAMRANALPPRPQKTREDAAQTTPGDATPSPPSAEAVLDALRSARPEREAIALDGQHHTLAANAPRTTEFLTGLKSTPGQSRSADSESHRTLQPDGTILPRRAGRVVREGDRWFFAAESDHRDHPEPPMELLPCQATEFMLSLWEANPHGLVFVVTGEITLYDGVNYLLPRVAIRQAVSDNLRK